ncbi:MAG: LPS export ABC transporter permease LptF [Ahniella sp.]|nr:LPS export ABC transporter permease LptF [Ahniella sp.]
MLRIIDRYLARELAGAFASVSLVLGFVLFGGLMADVLNRVARGRIPAGLLLSQVGLRSLDALSMLLPLGFFLAVYLAYSRLYRDGEAGVMAASGVNNGGFLKPVLWLALPLMSLLAINTLYWSPQALAKADQMVREANRSLLVAGMEPGRFVDLPGRYGVIYVGEMSDDGTTFKRLFVQHEKEDRVDIVTAASGKLYADRQGRERFLRLEEGFRVEGSLSAPDFRSMRFATNDVRLPDSEEGSGKRAESLRTGDVLLASGNASDRAELHWRLGIPISVLVLALLAIPLAHTRPREPRFGAGLIAVVGYIVYSNMLAAGRGWLAEGKIPMSLGLWWIHAIVLIIALLMYWSRTRLPRPKAVT